ncbi:MAG: META domain-containing protein [Mailhella sp.]|nr:META domain-containing protein [Mailhella sp.]
MKTSSLHGLWKDKSGNFFFLDEDGSLGLPRRSDAAGLTWAFDGSILTFTEVKAPGESPTQHRFVLQKKGLFGLEFLDESGKPVSWSRSYKKVGKLEGTLFYRERLMLPPEVCVSVQLRPLKKNNVAGKSIAFADGRAGLGFKVYYLASDMDDMARLEAAVHYGNEPLFATPDTEIVSLEEKPSVLLHHAVPSRKDSLPLAGTYWRLKELDGKKAEHFTGQPEAHLILRDKGEAMGSDGCNNFFMDWKTEGESITFAPGGATLRICPSGEEQALKLMQMFPSVQKWNISGSRLELHSADKLEAVFEAVEM